MYKEIYLAKFIERLNTYQIIYTTPFLVLYEDWFTEVSNPLQNEINDNLLLLATEKHKKYLEIVLSKIKKNIIYNEISLSLNKWIEKYDLSNFSFPFIENIEVKQVLATSIDQINLDYEKKKNATNMQIDFFCYAAMLELQKMIEFINSKFNDVLKDKKQEKVIPKISNFGLINKEFIEDIRLFLHSINYGFGIEEDNIVIVPDNLTHKYFIDNFDISDNILKYYFATNKHLISKSEYEYFIKNGYIGKYEYIKRPYNIKIFGAFHAPTKFIFCLESIFHMGNSHINGNKVEYLSDLVPYFLEYSKGFKLGYDSFYDAEIKPLLIDGFADKSDYINKVFEFISKNVAFSHSWLSNNGGFSYDGMNKGSILVSNGFEDGQKQGFFYKAWTIVFSNNNLFEPLFEKYYLKDKSIEMGIKDAKKEEISSIKKHSDLITHDSKLKDSDGFPIDKTGKQIGLIDEDGNIIITLQSNFLISIKENSCIVFNPNDKLKVNNAVDTLINYLTYNFYENIEGYFLLDLSEEAKKRKRLRTKEPLKILKIQMYFDWITKWLNYIGNVFNFEFKLLFYAKYKEKIKMDVLSIETGLKVLKSPKSHVDFTNRWIEETDKNIELEAKAKNKSYITTNQTPDFTTKRELQQIENISSENMILKHSHIFKANAFEVWQHMFDEFGINESSRTDVKFMFEEMRKEGEGLIHKTVNQKTFLEWITSTYDGLIIEKTSNHSRTKSRLQTYARAKKLYKE